MAMPKDIQFHTFSTSITYEKLYSTKITLAHGVVHIINYLIMTRDVKKAKTPKNSQMHMVDQNLFD